MTDDHHLGTGSDAGSWETTMRVRPFAARHDELVLKGEAWGDTADPAVVLIAGAGEQLIWWQPQFVVALVAARYRVIRFDARDVGTSTWLDLPPVRRSPGGMPAAAYGLDDLAGDVVSVLDALSIDAVHLVGASMGAMVAQEVTLLHPHRVRSLVSFMGTTGNPDVGQPTTDAARLLFKGPPSTRSGFMESRTAVRRMMAASGSFDDDTAAAFAGEEFDRGFNPHGTARHLAAVRTAGDRTDRLRRIATPTLVVHGTADPVIHASGGLATADAIPNASYLELGDLGHDLPPHAWPELLPALLSLFASN